MPRYTRYGREGLVDWDYVAASREELASIDEALLKGPTQKALDEQLQLTRLLLALAPHSILSYPVCVRHTHQAKPDFQLLVGERRISIEATKIASSNYEHAAALQRQGLGRVLMRGEFLRRNQPRMSKEETIQRGFFPGQLVFPPSLDEVDHAWWEHFQKSVLRKLEILSQPDFQHGDEDWLILEDRLGSKNWQIEDRLPPVGAWLAPFWRRNRSFGRIFIQAEDITWVALMTHGRSGMLAHVPEA